MAFDVSIQNGNKLAPSSCQRVEDVLFVWFSKLPFADPVLLRQTRPWILLFRAFAISSLLSYVWKISYIMIFFKAR
jgi:hypothetical protein